jgi:addiction module RelE/StbE family toxin
MSSYNIEITQKAECDLSEIGLYISKELLEPKIAKKLIEKISKDILSLEEMPFRHQLVQDKRLAEQWIRKIIVENYTVFYIVNEVKKIVTVVRILYSRREWENLL